MKLYHEDFYRARLERDAKDWRFAQLLLGDGWRPLSEYVYDRSYVYAAGVSGWHDNYIIFVGRGGKYQVSDWWRPHNRNEPFHGHVNYWQPLPEGIDPFVEARAIFPPSEAPPPKPVRPPEPVYEPGPPTARLTPVPRGLLVAMRAGAVLHERAWRWTTWTLAPPGLAPQRVGTRGIESLRQLAFIERVGVLPPGDLTCFHDFDWKISQAGLAWLAANARATKCA
jgi:hypothetical protein